MIISAIKKNSGVTMIELMIVVVIIGILAGLAAPQYGDLIKKQTLVSESRRITSLLKLARSEARSRGAHVTISREDDTDWSGDLSVYENTDPASLASVDEEIKISQGGRSLVADASFDTPYITFNPRGWARTAFSVALCTSATANTHGRLIEVNRVGKISERSLEDDESCSQ